MASLMDRGSLPATTLRRSAAPATIHTVRASTNGPSGRYRDNLVRTVKADGSVILSTARGGKVLSVTTSFGATVTLTSAMRHAPQPHIVRALGSARLPRGEARVSRRGDVRHAAPAPSHAHDATAEAWRDLRSSLPAIGQD
jgi:hypothetical protein